MAGDATNAISAISGILVPCETELIRFHEGREWGQARYFGVSNQHNIGAGGRGILLRGSAEIVVRVGCSSRRDQNRCCRPWPPPFLRGW